MKYLQDRYFADLNAHCHAGGFFEIGKGGVWECYPHRFLQNKFYFIWEGSCTIKIEGETVRGIPGRWFFIPAGAAHEYINDTEAPFAQYWMHFDLLPREADLFASLNLPCCIDVPLDGEVAGLFHRYAKLVKYDTLPNKIMIKSILLALVGDYIQLSLPEEVGVFDDEDARLRAVLAYVKEHIREDISNSVLAEQFHMHPNHFVRYFRNKMGITPAKYVTAQRMELAKHLLEETKLTVSEIVEEVGINDLSSFSKLFKKYCGHSPRQYRERLLLAVVIPTMDGEET